MDFAQRTERREQIIARLRNKAVISRPLVNGICKGLGFPLINMEIVEENSEQVLNLFFEDDNEILGIPLVHIVRWAKIPDPETE